jgi:hypothetical protein
MPSLQSLLFTYLSVVIRRCQCIALTTIHQTDSRFLDRNDQCLNCRGGGGGWGVETPSCLLNPPNKMPWDTLGGQFQPPPLLMILNRLCVMTMTMNRQMSTPHLFFDNSNPGNDENCLHLRSTE